MYRVTDSVFSKIRVLVDTCLFLKKYLISFALPRHFAGQIWPFQSGTLRQKWWEQKGLKLMKLTDIAQSCSQSRSNNDPKKRAKYSCISKWASLSLINILVAIIQWISCYWIYSGAVNKYYLIKPNSKNVKFLFEYIQEMVW